MNHPNDIKLARALSQDIVRKVANDGNWRAHIPICSVARVLDTLTPPDDWQGPTKESFFVKDLVMIDARLRDWKRVMGEHIQPSYKIKYCGYDSQILKRLVLREPNETEKPPYCVFTADTNTPLDCLSGLGNPLVKLYPASKKEDPNNPAQAHSEDSQKKKDNDIEEQDNVMVYVNVETTDTVQIALEKIRIATNGDNSARAILRLDPKDKKRSDLPKYDIRSFTDFIKQVLFGLQSHLPNICGLCISDGRYFCHELSEFQTQIDSLLNSIEEVYSYVKEKTKYNFSILEIDTEFDVVDLKNYKEAHNFEMCAQHFIEKSKYFLDNGIKIHISASSYFSVCSHFLFTPFKGVVDGKVQLGVGYLKKPDPKPNKDNIGVLAKSKSTRFSKSTSLLISQSTFKALETCPAVPKEKFILCREEDGKENQICKVKLPSNTFRTNDFLKNGDGHWLYLDKVDPRQLEHDTINVHAFRFEGPEKKFEINFKPQGDGFRTLKSEDWQEVLNHGHLLILNEKKNKHFDSYLLSESSLFVYDYKVIVKTCGISSPLLCATEIVKKAAELGTYITSIVFSRKNFLYSTIGQCYPHRSIEEEVSFLTNNLCKKLDLKPYFSKSVGDQKDESLPWGLDLGPDGCDHWFIFAAARSEVKTLSSEKVPPSNFEITMTGRMLPEQLKYFQNHSDAPSSQQNIAQKAGFADLTPKAKIDEWLFEPCGFSFNGLQKNGYVTVHVTPELPQCFISYETNIPDLETEYHNILNKLINTFKPEHFTCLIQTTKLEDLKFADKQTMTFGNVAGYRRTHPVSNDDSKNIPDLYGVPLLFERWITTEPDSDLYT